MELIQDSAEHYFLMTLEDLKNKSDGWLCMYFSLSKTLKHDDLVADLSKIEEKIEGGRQQAEKLANELKEKLDAFEGAICVFSDMDVFVLVQAKDKMQSVQAKEVFAHVSKTLPEGLADFDALNKQFQSYLKMADQKFLGEKRHKAYGELGNKHKVGSIQSRRKRREEPLVMMVEDDRFTAHYASTILNGSFDLILCKNAEEAIVSYIDNAPDVVFLDIHLPGLSGHGALQAIHAADPKAFVVMLSVDTVQDNIVKASKMGASKFLKKPFTKERLLETVKMSPYVRQLTRSDRAGSESMY